MPVPHILMNAPDAAGVTLHKLSPQFDAGDILAQRALELTPHETVESYTARLALLAQPMVQEVLQNLPVAWQRAVPQDEARARWFLAPDFAMRRIDWSRSVAQILSQSRAFGHYGVLADVTVQYGQQTVTRSYAIYDLDAWTEAHVHCAGTCLMDVRGHIVVTVRDGYVCLKSYELLS
jgi:methionyl-tRNA formyltransferase